MDIMLFVSFKKKIAVKLVNFSSLIRTVLVCNFSFFDISNYKNIYFSILLCGYKTISLEIIDWDMCIWNITPKCEHDVCVNLKYSFRCHFFFTCPLGTLYFYRNFNLTNAYTKLSLSKSQLCQRPFINKNHLRS